MPPTSPDSKPDGAAARPWWKLRRQPRPSSLELGHGLFRLWLVNVLVGTLIGSLWFFDAPADRAPWIRVYVSLALVSSVAVLALLPGIAYLGIWRWVKNWRLACLLAGFVGAGFLVILYTDTIVYRLLRYHFFDSAVLNVAFTEGSGDSIILGSYVFTTAAIIIGSLTLVQSVCAGYFTRRVQALRDRGERGNLLLQPKSVLVLGFLPSLVFSQSVSAAADVTQNREALRAVQVIPIVPRVRLGQILEPLLEPGADRPPELDLLPEGARLNWPQVTPELSPDVERHNVFICVLDSWRRDMFTPELTPNLHAYAENARVFADHLSGGNGTRYGLFTMLYGLHGSYWFPVLAQRRAPVMLETLQRAGYDVRIFSSASMSFPEFRDTAWVDVPETSILDSFPPGLVSWEKDELLADAFEGWMERRRVTHDTRPFFAFVLIDAPHQPYENPGGPYAPAVESLDYIELGRTTKGPELRSLQVRVRNAYKNSVLHADKTAGRILDALERSGEGDSTYTIVTGDHGEEFFECGFWGHTSSFSPEQVQVPFVFKGPGVSPGVEVLPTSHLDISNTLLELLGADPADRAGYSLGEDLLDPPAHRERVVGGWSDIGLWTSSGIFDLPLSAPGIGGWVSEIECYDQRWRPVKDLAAHCRSERPALERMARECVRFLDIR